MRLAYVTAEGRGANDLLIARVARRLIDEGAAVAGVVQHNTELLGQRACDMDLRVLPTGPVICISQSLGPEARGCRLDADALERAVALVQTTLDRPTELLVVNKFGKHESEGRGFRDLIGEALMRGIPVLTAVGSANLAAFGKFASGLAEELPASEAVLLDWCRAQRRAGAA